MLAKAAASASVPPIRGTVYLDSHDVKIIQYKAALYKLVEMSRLLNVFAKNLEKPSANNIIPLVNYILILFEGPLFNVHPVMRKRFQLLCTFKVCKVAQITPTLNTADIDFPAQFPLKNEDEQSLKMCIYDSELQWKLLGCLQSIVSNSISIYERKLRQIQIERNAKRPTDSLGRPIPLDLSSFEDILKPKESAICLDLAVLINNKEEDTSLRSMHKLQTQVLSKFITYFNSKVLPVIRGYYLQLKRFSLEKSPSQTSLKDLQHWEFSNHRIYALMLRCLYISDMIASLARQIYYPNQSYFNEVRTRLSSENVFAYQEALQKIERTCSSLEDQREVPTLLETLAFYSKQGITHPVQPKSIVEVYQNCISKVVPNIIEALSNLETFCTMWKYIECNTVVVRSFDNHTDEQLKRMLEERMAVDELAHVEKAASKQKIMQNQSSLSPPGSGTSSRGSLKRKTIVKSNNSPNISVLTSSTPSPGKVSPLMTRSDSSEKSYTRFSIYGSPQVSRRGSISENRMATFTGSPQVSRRGSVSENRLSSYTGVVAIPGGDQKTVTKSSFSDLKRGGRPRSSSLQSPLDETRNSKPSSSLQSRSNSLQADAANNQKIVQSAVRSFANCGRANAKSERNDTKTSSYTRGFKNQARLSPPKDPLKPKTELNGSSTISSELSSLTIDETDRNTKVEKKEKGDDICNENIQFDGIVEDFSCIKKVRFTGVPPMSNEEKRSPTRKGWYKKPAVLHYPPPPSTIATQKYRLRQEGIAFRTSLREIGGDSKKTSFLMNEDLSPPRESTTQRLTSKLRDKLR